MKSQDRKIIIKIKIFLKKIHNSKMQIIYLQLNIKNTKCIKVKTNQSTSA